MSRDEAREVLTGVLMTAEPDGLRLVATDSYRLAVRDLPGTTLLQEGQSVLIPGRALADAATWAAHATATLIRRLPRPGGSPAR